MGATSGGGGGHHPPPLTEDARYEVDLEEVVDQLCRSSADGELVRRADYLPCAEPLPSRGVVLEATEDLRSVLFPGFFGSAEVRPETLRFHFGCTIDRVQRVLETQIRRGLAFSCSEVQCTKACEEQAAAITATFISRLPRIQRSVATDIRAAYEGDPALKTPSEAIFCYPGPFAITSYRIAHELHGLGVPLLPRMITEQAHSATGIDIHPGAEIGEHFFIDHGTGVVIGETCVIGRGVCIYQGVTLGAKSFPLDEQGNPIKGIPRHPIIEDDVIIYSGATILGRVTIGRGSIIGGNVWLTRSVAPGSRITIQPPRADRFEYGAGI